MFFLFPAATGGKSEGGAVEHLSGRAYKGMAREHNVDASTREIAAVIFDSITDGVLTPHHECGNTPFDRFCFDSTHSLSAA